MALANGSRLGPYEIVAPVGAGGMGEVYRARDTRLDRTVAVKILPAEFANDAKLKVRFEREAKTISALSHPHICALHDVGPGYLVMEYCEGKTLAKRIADGALPAAQVIEYGTQIADALDKAHRAGIIHRDLKPSNIMITKSGVKLLDFGLAKQQTGSSPEQSTVQQVTEEGNLLGTVQYMAPELFQGKEADERSDIFALGLVLYEMATGKPAFSGDSRASLIAAILEHEPPHVEGHSALDRLIRACLEKDPAERIQSAHDVLLQLRWAGERDRPPSASSKARIALSWVVIAAAVLAIASALAWTTRRRPAARPARFELQPPPDVVLGAINRGGAGPVAVSPDGEWVAFQAKNRDTDRLGIYLRSTTQLDTRLIMAAQDVRDPFFSPDSKWLGFFGDGALRKVAVGGGAPTVICSSKNVRGASWGDDGTIIFSDMQDIRRVSADGGEARAVTSPNMPERHVWPRFLPGSEYALITTMRGMGDRWRKIALLRIGDGSVRELVPGTFPRFAGDRIIYSYAGTLFALPFDPRRAEVTGPTRPVLDDVFTYHGSGVAVFDVSQDGALVYVPGAERPRDSEIVWIDRSGQVVRTLPEKRTWISAVMSPDGKTIAAAARDGVEESDIWTFDLQRGGWSRLTTGVQASASMAWSPDSRSIVLSSVASGEGKLVRVSVAGGPPQPLTSGANHNDAAPAVSADGRAIVFMRVVTPAQPQLMTLSTTSDNVLRPFVPSASLQAMPAFSPDGKWVAYESDETGQREVHVRPFPAGEPRVTVSVGGGEKPFWSADSRELFFLKPKQVWSVAVSTNGGFHAGPPKHQFTVDWLGEPWSENVQAMPDGRTFLMIRRAPEVNVARRIVYAPNWIDEIKRAAKE